MSSNWAYVFIPLSAVALSAAVYFYLANRRRDRERELLFEVGTRISATLDRDEVLELILDGLQEVVGYNAAGIFLVDVDNDEISHHMLRGYDEDSVSKVRLKVGDGLVGFSAEEAKSLVVNDVRRNPHYINARANTRSELVTPLSVAGAVIAVINLESDRARAYRNRHLKLLQTFGAQAAVAIENASCYTDAQEKRYLEQELAIAGEIQQALLPHSPPEIPGLDVAAFMKPTESVGGDLYDLVPLNEGRLGVAIGDISGKGTPAAILMASLYASFRSLTRRDLSLSDIMRQLNNLLCENFGIGRFATFFYGVICTRSMEIEYSNAGHFAPILIKPGEGPRFLSDGGIVLGYIPDSRYSESIEKIESGDVLVLYTDGIIEAENPDGEMFGEERLTEICATMIGRSAREVLKGIRKAVGEHCGDSEQIDDITLVVVRAV